MGKTFQSDLSIEMRLSIMNLNLEKEAKKENDDVIAFKYQGI